jgi:hypothetical protein
MSLVGPVSRRNQHSIDSITDFPLIDNLPLYWELLTRNDLDSYVQLRKDFYDEMNKSKKGERLEAFVRRLMKVRSFIERGDNDDWKRGLVCGIIFLENSLAIHIQQFRLLLGKCKSSINGSLQAIGFVANPQGGPIEKELYYKVPIFQRERSDIKKWTVRYCKAPINPFGRKVPPLPKVELPKNQFISMPQKSQTDFKPKPDIENVGTEPTNPRSVPRFMVPIKFRYKFYNLLHQNISIQTDT